MTTTQPAEIMELPVTRITDETPDIKTFRLDLGHHRPFTFLPGQFIILRTEIWNPVKDRMTKVNRAFSLASSPLERDYIEFSAKKYQDGLVTPWLHEKVRLGDTLTVKGPSGDFVFRDGESPTLVLMAGGIGIAPFRSMVRYIRDKGLPVATHLFYSARSPADLSYREEWDRLAGEHPNFHPSFTVTREHLGWTGRVGRIDAALIGNALKDPAALYYLCGPDPMIQDLRSLLNDAGVGPDRVRFEKW
jgi:ferredoxin-NADP reductase